MNTLGDDNGYRPTTWSNRALLGPCPRCGGTLELTNDDAGTVMKCSMCSRRSPIIETPTERTLPADTTMSRNQPETIGANHD